MQTMMNAERSAARPLPFGLTAPGAMWSGGLNSCNEKPFSGWPGMGGREEEEEEAKTRWDRPAMGAGRRAVVI